MSLPTAEDLDAITIWPWVNKYQTKEDEGHVLIVTREEADQIRAIATLLDVSPVF